MCYTLDRSATVQTGPGAHPPFCTISTGSFSGVKSGRGVTLTPHPLLVPLSRKGRAIPLLPLWAVRPVQSLSTHRIEMYVESSKTEIFSSVTPKLYLSFCLQTMIKDQA